MTTPPPLPAPRFLSVWQIFGVLFAGTLVLVVVGAVVLWLAPERDLSEVPNIVHLEVQHAEMVKGSLGISATWTIRVHNMSPKIVYYDLRYRADYYASTGTLVDSERGTLYERLEPGETRTFTEVPGGIIPRAATRGEFDVVDAKSIVRRPLPAEERARERAR